MEGWTVILFLLAALTCSCLSTEEETSSSFDGQIERLNNEVIKEPRQEQEYPTVDDDDDGVVLLSRGERAMGISMVEAGVTQEAHHRVKRLSFKTPGLTWTHHIPYIITFKGEARRMRLRTVLDHIEDQLCVKFFDVQDKIELLVKDKKWLTKHGFKTNAYIRFQNGKGCVAVQGKGRGKKARNVSPCYKYLSMMHETLHALGAIHTQKMPGRDKYITVHRSNIRASKYSQYQKSVKPYRLNAEFFDSHSNLLYGTTFFGKSKNPDNPTYDFLRPDMGKLDGMRSTKTLVYEMNQNYKCRETFCSGVKTDCGPGYLTFVHDKCVCVCPDQYDPETNCTTLIKKVEGPKSWPNMPFTLYKADECPDGFTEGMIPITVKSPPEQSEGVPLPTDRNTLKIAVCTKATPTQNIDWNDWPLGSTCVGRANDGPCGLPFDWSRFTIRSDQANPDPLQGPVGDVKIVGRDIQMNFCCMDGASSSLPAKLPTSKKFRLLKTKGGCQEVEGMFSAETNIKIKAKTKIGGFKPDFSQENGKFRHTSCLYTPPTYGCNQIFKLDSTRRTVTFSLPKKGSVRECNRRCFYAFEVPTKSRLRLTFNKFSIHPQDRFYVKRFHPWTNPFRVTADSRPTQIITERNYLFVEFWSSDEEGSQYEGADLTVDLLLDGEMCYDADLQGSDYAGDKAVSELYETCLPWKDAVTCPDFPWKYSLILLNSDNKCRNLDVVEMLQPWCYVTIRGGTCVRRYCDVCNEADPRDANENCRAEIDADDAACSHVEFRNKCFKSCGASTTPYDSRTVTCALPSLRGTVFRMVRPRKSSYGAGSTVKLICGIVASQIKCSTHGWEPFDDNRCVARKCMDRSLLCRDALERFSSFCTHKESNKYAVAFCRKSCGGCKKHWFLPRDNIACLSVKPLRFLLTLGTAVIFIHYYYIT